MLWFFQISNHLTKLTLFTPAGWRCSRKKLKEWCRRLNLKATGSRTDGMKVLEVGTSLTFSKCRVKGRIKSLMKSHGTFTTIVGGFLRISGISFTTVDANRAGYILSYIWELRKQINTQYLFSFKITLCFRHTSKTQNVWSIKCKGSGNPSKPVFQHISFFLHHQCTALWFASIVSGVFPQPAPNPKRQALLD